MRAALVSYFDLRRSFGLGDTALKNDCVNQAPDVGNVPISNPLGWGTSVQVSSVTPHVIAEWRTEALMQIGRHGVVPFGWSGTAPQRAEFDRELASWVGQHKIEFCNVVIFAVGVAYIQLQFEAGIPPEYAEGVLGCFEYAAYTESVSARLADVASEHFYEAKSPGSTSLEWLTERRPPKKRKSLDGEREIVELDQFKAFTRLYICVDDGDSDMLKQLLESQKVKPVDHLTFLDRGILHYTWPACVLEPASVKQPSTPDERMRELEPLLADIVIAHSFLGVCEAYMGLVRDEIADQAQYFGQAWKLRNSLELNRMRGMALAVVNLTQFAPLTQSEEDQAYFARFDHSAGLESMRNQILEAAGVLFEVQSIEQQEEARRQQEESGRRERTLSSAVGVLTFLTVFSVVTDVYNFMDPNSTQGAPELAARWFVLGVTALLLLLVSALIAITMTYRRWHKLPCKFIREPDPSARRAPR